MFKLPGIFRGDTIGVGECPQLPEPTREEEDKAIADIVKAAGIRSCSTDSLTINNRIVSAIPFAAAAISFTANNTSTIGCENIIAISKKYRETVYNVSCKLSKAVSKISNSSIVVNGLEFIADGGKLNINCGSGLKIEQRAKVNNIVDINLTNNDLNSINNTVKSFLNDTKDILQKNVSDLGSSERGNKYFEQLQKSLNSINMDVSSNDVLNDITVSLSQQNYIVFRARYGGEINLSASSCDLIQTSLIDTYSKIIVDNMVKKALNNSITTINKVDENIKQDSEGKGITNLEKNFWDNFASIAKSMYSAAAVIILIIFGIVGFVLYKLGSSPAGQKAIEKRLGGK